LIPWHLSEKFFEYFLQPLLFRKYRIRLDRRKKVILGVIMVLLSGALVFYVGKTFSSFMRHQDSVMAAATNILVLLKMLYNGVVPMVNILLIPINTAFAFIQGGEVGWLKLIFSLYLLFLPVIFVVNVAYRFFTTSRSLRRAVKLRDEAMRDVNIVHFAEDAKDDEIFFGIDTNRNGTPFYAKRRWLQGHIQVVGAPGSGKTESIIQPLWFQAVRRNVPTIVLDGKGSRQNVDKFYTIASSLAQGHEIIYFNPADPDRSATYNPLQRGTMAEIKNRLLASLNAANFSATSRERLDYYLNLILRAIKETNSFLTLHELWQYFESKTHVHNQLRKINDRQVYNGLSELLSNYQTFQTETALFGTLLREICQSEYAWLLDTVEPELDILDVYTGRKDCYLTLPISPNDTTASFLGQLILGDTLATFHHLARERDSGGDQERIDEGLLIIDEAAKFVNPQFIDLLRASRQIGVSVCYTDQSLAELENPVLHLSKAFVEQLADHTNVIFCFHLGSPESIAAIINRIGPEKKKEKPIDKPAAKKGESKIAQTEKEVDVLDPNFLKNLEVGRCLAFVRQPRLLSVLKTGYFKFEQLLPYARQEAEETRPIQQN
jgi:hypothetical protein